MRGPLHRLAERFGEESPEEIVRRNPEHSRVIMRGVLTLNMIGTAAVASMCLLPVAERQIHEDSSAVSDHAVSLLEDTPKILAGGLGAWASLEFASLLLVTRRQPDLHEDY